MRREGMVLLRKPPGITSFAALGALKRALGTRRVGHTGTLDRFASGLLIALAGRLTRIGWLITGLPKRYRATVRLGEQTATLDPEGPVELRRPLPSEQALRDALPAFTGRIRQVPPAYSAVHVGGERASRLARRGNPVQPQAREAYVESLRITAIDLPDVTIEVVCGKGTYVRSLARDVAAAAGSCGYLTALQRLSIGAFTVDEAAPAGSAGAGDLLPPAAFLHRIDGLEAHGVTPDGARRIRNGQPVESGFLSSQPSGARLCALLDDGELLAVIEPAAAAGGGRRAWRYRCVLAGGAGSAPQPNVTEPAA